MLSPALNNLFEAFCRVSLSVERIEHSKMKNRLLNFTILIEKNEDGMYVGSVPALRGCNTQGKTLDELSKNIKEAIALCLEACKEIPKEEFVGVQQVQVRI